MFQDFDFRSIRVNSPLVLVVNGKKFGIDKQAPSVLAVHALCDWWKNLQQEQTWTVLHSYLWLYKLNIFSYPLSCSFHDIHVQLYVSSSEQAIKYLFINFMFWLFIFLSRLIKYSRNFCTIHVSWVGSTTSGICDLKLHLAYLPNFFPFEPEY